MRDNKYRPRQIEEIDGHLGLNEPVLQDAVELHPRATGAKDHGLDEFADCDQPALKIELKRRGAATKSYVGPPETMEANSESCAAAASCHISCLQTSLVQAG